MSGTSGGRRGQERDHEEASDPGELTRAILDTVMDGIITIDDHGTIQSFNPAAERLFGYTAAEAIGQNVRMLMPGTDSAQHGRHLERYLETREAHVIGIGREVQGRRKDESLFPCYLGVSEARYQGKRIFVGSLHDLTEQRRVEQERDRYFATTPDLLCTIAADGYFRLLNPAWRKCLGHTQEELRAEPVQSFVHPDDPPLAIRQNAWDDQTKSAAIQNRLRCKDGSYKWMEWVIVPAEEDGLLVAAARDITERKDVDRIKGEFVSMVSHELRTPLTSIRGSLGLLEQPPPALSGDKRQALVRIARENTDRLIRLINDVLDLDKIESGKLELQARSIDVETLVDEALTNVSSSAEQREISIEQHISSGARIVADHDRMVQVLVNLLGNAIKFSPRGGVVKVVTTEVARMERISVIDQGPGVAPEHRSRLFNKFEQLDASDRRAKGGSGLGLAISKAIVEQHRGAIGVNSTLGEGSEFFFTVPTKPPAIAKTATAPDARQRILIVEDHPDVAQVLRTLLEGGGYQVDTAATVATAKQALAGQSVDVILLDIGLPDGSGIELREWMQGQPNSRDVPVIVITGQHDYAAAALGGPARTLWLAKPFSAQDVLQAIRRAVHQPGTDVLVLVVEDDDATRQVLTEQIRQLGVSCIEASGGAEAVRLLRDRYPDLIVLDVGIDDMDGFELVDRFRHSKVRATPLVVYTSRDLSALERQQLTLGMTRHLIKSRTTQDQFIGAVRDLLDGLLPSSVTHSL